MKQKFDIVFHEEVEKLEGCEVNTIGTTKVRPTIITTINHVDVLLAGEFRKLLHILEGMK